MGIMKRGIKFYLWNLQSALPRCAPQVLSISAGRGGAGQGLLFAGRGTNIYKHFLFFSKIHKKVLFSKTPILFCLYILKSSKVNKSSEVQGLKDEATKEELGVVKVGPEEIQTKCISDGVPGKKL